MVELTTLPLLDLIRFASSWTDTLRRDAAVTALLIADLDVEFSNALHEGIRTGRYRVDEKLIVDLYESRPKAARARLVGSSAFGYLKPSAFEHRFLETYRSKGLNARERRDLAETLGGYLWRHPEREDWCAPILLGLLRSSGWDRVRALYMVRHLSALKERDREIVKRSLRDRSPYVRMNAHNLLFWWLKRKSELSPDLRDFCLSPEIRAIAFDRYQRDPNVDVQTCAYYFLKAREPRAGHKPPKGMPVPPPRRKRRKRPSP